MNILTIAEEMDNVGADGVDFIPIFYNPEIAPIISSYTREEFEKQNCYLKSGRRYWKIVSGNKEYI